MLNPNNDRLDYGQILSPPLNYKLDFAIGTTYSLDLDALVGACIALGLSAETDSDLMYNPICLLEALRSTGDKVALFCERGQIHLPGKVTPLYVLLEKMVFQVGMQKKRGIAKYPSFHPKFWLLRYVDDNKNVLYRIIVLSRNLTFDRSWDVTFCMDGKVTNEGSDKNTPVADFIDYLCGFLSDTDNGKNKKKKIKIIEKELKKVKFSTDSKEFYDYDFIPIGIKSSDGGVHNINTYPLFTQWHEELLIMSPFLSGGVIREFNDLNNRRNNVLITRAVSLSKLKPQDCDSFRIYTMKDAVVDGETIISEEGTDTRCQDIHAKLYMTKRYSDVDLYLGSLNASHNALNGNVEFMVRLRSKNRYLNLSKLTEQIFCGSEDGDNNPFQMVQLGGTYAAEEEPTHKLDEVIKEIARLEPKAYVSPNGETYDIRIAFGDYKPPYKVIVSPLLSNKTAEFSADVCFASLAVTQLSQFYKISVSDDTHTVSRVLMIPTEGIPEERDKAIVSGVVNDKSSFCQYIAFLLGDDSVVSALESSSLKLIEGSSSALARREYELPALYEKMLKTAATNPDKFKELDFLMQAISDDGVAPEGFEELYSTFKKVVKLSG